VCTCSSINPTNGAMMGLSETDIHPFIIKIWLEETADEANRPMWRGHIVHVPDGEGRYLEELDNIAAFIAPYLENMGVKFGLLWQVKHWLSRWRLSRIGRS